MRFTLTIDSAGFHQSVLGLAPIGAAVHAQRATDAAGCRGLKVGNAQVSEMHCNFLINLGGATAADIETLGETVRKRVKENSGAELEWEIKRVGVAKPAQ